jgi:hypothetical protein
MGRVATAFGLVGVVALAGAAAYAGSRAEVGTVTEGQNLAAPVERVRVEVLNAGGVAGRAGAATVRLRDLGFDVVSYRNAGSFGRDSSSVVDRVGRLELARAVAGVLGIQQVISDPDPNLFVDVTVVLGMDWRGGEGAEGSEGAAATRAPWDPRRWIGR